MPKLDKKEGYILYYSNFDTYESCPQKLLWSRGWHDIDLGHGMGKRRPVPVKKSEHDSIMGQAIQYAIEHLYNDQLWKSPHNLLQTLHDLAAQKLYKEMAKAHIDWFFAPSQQEMFAIVSAGVEGYLKTMKHNRLLGTFNQAEMEFLCYDKEGFPMGGRADMVIRREDTGVLILDGKNSKSRGKYTDPDQLRWYALCYYLCYGALPERLAFVYYRYPYGTPIKNEFGQETSEVESGLTDVPFTMADLEGLSQRIVLAHEGMRAHQFEAKPEPAQCRFCEYETVCDARKATKRTRTKKPTTLEQRIQESGGLIEL